MKVDLVGTTNGIYSLRGAEKFCQDFARVCYSERDFGEVKREKYNANLVEKRLIKSGHHSVFDHFKFNLYIDGLPKAMAMVLNNEGVYATSEKSARYTEMSDIPEKQKILYDKWKGIFVGEIDKIFPSVENRDARIGKLAQENARYVTSVFTPTKMGYTLSLRQLNILADNFEWFGRRRSGDEFKDRLFDEGMRPFLDSEVVNRFRIDGLFDKSNRKVKLFGWGLEEYFGEDVYSTNLKMSFACLAQNHRHRTIHNHMFGGWGLGAPNGYFRPPIVRANKKLSDEWYRDLDSVADDDFPQAQIIRVAERGNREDLEMKLRERNCGLAQLEIVRVMDGLLERYSKYVPAMGELRGAACLTSGDGCKKDGCVFGAEHAVDRLV